MSAYQPSRRNLLKTIGASAATMAFPSILRAQDKQKKPNILFIAVDDLRPQLHCYGHDYMISPNIDRLASEGVLFERAYCQVAVCGASRCSLLSGLRPTPKRFLRYDDRLEELAPGITSLPGHFKDHGYTTISNGKIFHHGNDHAHAWSEKPWHAPQVGGSWRNYLVEENQKIEASNDRGPAFEIADVDDEAYSDGKCFEKTKSDLYRLSKQEKPFFLAAGFLKPHLPFNAPKKYWDYYDRDEIDLADNPFRPKGAPDAAMHNWGELRNYYNIPPKGPLPEDQARTLVHGYYACVSYTDALIGKLLDELDKSGLRDNTIVILWGDHGWNLGEHGLWCKHCNFETSVHSAMMISAPGYKQNQRTSALTEYVDIYPSLCELCGLNQPGHLQGTSFVPLLNEPDRPWKSAALSRYGKGDTIKTDTHRYTEWKNNEGQIYAKMLYDHRSDPMENVNIADQPAQKKLVDSLSKAIEEGWTSCLPPT